MSEATEVPMVCEDCGGTLTDDDAIWSPGIGVLTHINYSQCISSLNERLTAATERAEAAEARRDVWEKRARKVVQERRALRVERDALRQDAALLSEFVSSDEIAMTYQTMGQYRAALLKFHTAALSALAVQPTTGEGDE